MIVGQGNNIGTKVIMTNVDCGDDVGVCRGDDVAVGDTYLKHIRVVVIVVIVVVIAFCVDNKLKGVEGDAFVDCGKDYIGRTAATPRRAKCFEV